MRLVYLLRSMVKIKLVMLMKDATKIAAITLVGLLIAVFLYPILHESGHSLAAVIAGAEVKEFHLFPLPNVLCDVHSVTIPGMIWIGFSGMLFPFLLVSVIQPKKFWLWHISFIMRGICLLSFLISIVGAFLYGTGFEIANEDITQVIAIAPAFSFVYIIGLMGLMIWDIILMVNSKPILRYLEFFDLAQQKSE